MGIFYFYNNRKPRKFNHVPILYNPEEEERQLRMQKRIHEIKKDMNALPENEKAPEPKTNFQEAFLSTSKHLRKRKEREERGEKPFFTNNVTLIILILALFGLFYFIFLR